LTTNSLANVSTYAVSLVVVFFLTPFVVRTLGDATYGLWVVLVSFLGYAALLELGVQPAVVKLVGQHRGSRDWEKLEELIAAALIFFAAVGLLAALGVALLLPKIAYTVVRDLGPVPGFQTFVLLLAADVFILFLTYLFAGILYGWQLYVVRNLIEVAALVLNAAALFVLLARGGLPVLVACKTGIDLLALIAIIIACRRALPGIRPALSRVRWSSFRELLAYGGKVFISSTASRLAMYTEPLVISSQLSAAATTFFAIPTRLVDYAKRAMWALSTGFMPMFSELDAGNQREVLQSVYLRYSRYIMTLTTVIAVLLLVYGRQFIGLWIGPEYAVQGGDALRLLVLAFWIQGWQPLTMRLFFGVGVLNLVVAVSAATAILTIVLSFVLVGSMGITGVALSRLVLVVLAQAVLLGHVSRYLRMPVAALFRESQMRPLFAGVALFVVTVGLARLIGSDSYARLAAGTLAALILGLPITFFSLFPGERRHLAERLRARTPRNATRR
jgi:O-antigen/teichoic acid export membrane protein